MLNWKNVNAFDRVIKLKQELKDIQAKVNVDPHNALIKEEATRILHEYEATKHDEFLLLQQKSKIRWLSEGDKNTKYFHQILKSRIQKTRIESICDENGTRHYGEEVATQFVNHFQTVFSDSEAKAMILDVTSEEIKASIFDIDGDRAAGPDGYTSQFLKKAWDVVGADVCKAIKEFFSKGADSYTTIFCHTPLNVH
ncbi:uncharacterized protein [Rutidosis leptorrhynchoides]|uniref:uncharacterized protein n=1 Tax=Rutidosis leptorrhynchoides TaxID=125765 RepID=UPI003A9A2AA6